MTRSHRVPLVLLNAFPLDKEQWEPLLAALDEADVPVGDIITFDPPGIGDMPATDEPPSLELIADAAVMAMRDVTGWSTALWVGCSMGGYVAMAVLDRHPDAVAGVGLLGTRASADTAEASARREQAARDAEAEDGIDDADSHARGLISEASAAKADLLALVRANVARQKGVGIAWGQRAMAARLPRLSILENASAPAFVMRGEDDAITSAADADAMAQALETEVVTLPGIGHLAGLEAPAAVAEQIAVLARAAR